MNHSSLPEPYAKKLNVAIADLKAQQRIASEMTTRAETAERQVRDLTLELGRTKARAKTAEAELASVRRRPAPPRNPTSACQEQHHAP